MTVQAERHPDAMVETVRWQICEAELVQSGGRGRGVNRAARDPLHLDILTNVCLPMTVDQPIRWDDHAPGRIEEMAALGVLPDGPAAAALVFPELWPTAKAAKMAAASARAKRPQENPLGFSSRKGLNGPSSLLDNYSRELGPFSGTPPSCPLLRSNDALVETWGLKPLALGALSRMERARARAERPDKRALKFEFLFDPDLIPDPEAWLSERTGLDVEVEYFTRATAPGIDLLRSGHVEEGLVVAGTSEP